jgi:hypothetical protein
MGLPNVPDHIIDYYHKYLARAGYGSLTRRQVQNVIKRVLKDFELADKLGYPEAEYNHAWVSAKKGTWSTWKRSNMDNVVWAFSSRIPKSQLNKRRSSARKRTSTRGPKRSTHKRRSVTHKRRSVTRKRRSNTSKRRSNTR